MSEQLISFFIEKYSEGFKFKKNHKFDEAIQKFLLCIEVDKTQFQPYREIFEIMMLLKRDYLEYFTWLLEPLKCDSINSITKQIEYLERTFKLNDEVEQNLAIKWVFVKEEQKSPFLYENALAYMKENKFFLANKYFDLYQISSLPYKISFEARSLIYGCKSMLNQRNALTYLEIQSPKLNLDDTLKEALDVLIRNDFLQITLNICLFLEKKFNSLIFLSELELKLQEQANEEYIRKNLNEIIKIYEIVIEKFPAKHELFKNLSFLLLQIDHYLVYFYSQKYQDLSPNDYMFHYDIGQMYSQRGDDKQALFHFEKVIEIYIRQVNQLDIELSSIFLILGECHYKLNQFKKSAIYYQKHLLTLKRGQFFGVASVSPIYSQLANCYYLQNKYGLCFEILPKTDFSSENISIMLQNIYLYCKDENIQKKVIDYGVNNSNSNPNCFLSHVFLIDQLRASKQPDLGEIYINRSEVIYKQNQEKYDNQILYQQLTSGVLFNQIKISFYFEQQKLDEAEKTALESYWKSNSQFTITSLIRIYKEKGELGKLKVFENLMKNQSQSYILEAARMLMKEKQYTQALYIFNSYYHIKEDDYSFYNDLGFCQECLGYFDKAIISYNIYLKRVQSGNSEVLYNLGNIMKKKEYIEEAKKYFKKCIILNPRFALAYQELGLIAKMKKKYEKATLLFGYAIDLNCELIDSLLEVIDIELLRDSKDYNKLNTYLQMAKIINSEDMRISKLSLLLKIKQQQKK